MKFIKFGDGGINLALVRSWKARQIEGGSGGDIGPFVPDGTHYDTLDIHYASGGIDTLHHEEATALKAWLEANAEDISQGPTSKEAQIR